MIGETMSESEQSPEFTANGVPDAIFDTYYEGNMRFPQSHLAIMIFAGEALLTHPNVDWDSFAQSKLTESQTNKISTAMTNVHRGHNIPIAAEAKATPQEKSVSTNRIQDLWTSVKGDVIDGAYRYSLFTQGMTEEAVRPSSNRITGEKLGAVREFFSKAENQDSVVEYQAVMSTATRATQTNEAVKNSIKVFKSQVGRIDIEQKRELLGNIATQIKTQVVEECGPRAGDFFDILTKNYNS